MKNFLLRNRRIMVDHEYFRDLAELKRYNDLCDLQAAGAISDLKRRERFTLVPDKPEHETRTMNGVKIPGSRIEETGITFKSDFVYKTHGGNVIAEIRKGTCKDIEIKSKLLLHKYKVTVKEY